MIESQKIESIPFSRFATLLKASKNSRASLCSYYQGDQNFELGRIRLVGKLQGTFLADFSGGKRDRRVKTGKKRDEGDFAHRNRDIPR